MHARMTYLQADSERIDDIVSQLESDQLPQFREQQGYKGFTVFADRGSGQVVGVTFWESEGDLKASEELGDKARGDAAETGEASAEPNVHRFEVLLDDMV